MKYGLTGECASEGDEEVGVRRVDTLQEDVEVQQNSIVLREWMLGRWLEL